MADETVFGADFSLLRGSGAPDKAKGSRGPALKAPTLKGTKKVPKLRGTTTRLKAAKASAPKKKLKNARTAGGY